MKNYYNIILSLTILSFMSVGWGQSDDSSLLFLPEDSINMGLNLSATQMPSVTLLKNDNRDIIEEIVGNDYTGSASTILSDNDFKGNFYSIESSTFLVEFRSNHDNLNQCSMNFFVYEDSTNDGSYNS